MSINSTDFATYVTSIDKKFIYAANKLPKEENAPFSIDSKGKFKITYSQAYRGTPSYWGSDDPQLTEDMGKVTLKVKKIVTGIIDPKNKTIRLDKECLEVTVPTGIKNITASLTEFKAEKEGLGVAVKVSVLLPEIKKSVTLEQVVNTKVEWHKA